MEKITKKEHTRNEAEERENRIRRIRSIVRRAAEIAYNRRNDDIDFTVISQGNTAEIANNLYAVDFIVTSRRNTE